MTFLRSILDDLIEKRLWPIAVALVLALVALPVVLGGGGDEPAPAPVAPATGGLTAGAATTDAAVTLEGDAAVDKRSRKGKVRNPFDQLAKTSAGTESTAVGGSTASPAPAGDAAPAAGGGASGSAPATSGGGTAPAARQDAGTTKAHDHGSDDSKAEPKTDEKAAGEQDERPAVVLRFGEVGDDLRRFDDPKKLTGLPTAGYPLLVFSGVRSDGKALRFMVNPLTRVRGDGRCRPSRDECRTLELRPGGTVWVDVAATPTEVAHYRLDVVRARR